jgi:hypothetical protein
MTRRPRVDRAAATNRVLRDVWGGTHRRALHADILHLRRDLSSLPFA